MGAVKNTNGTLYSRVGNKGRIAHNYLPYFPKHEIYIEPFFGAGGFYFNKPKAKYNLLNDLDKDVYNVWKVMSDPELKAELEALLAITPCDQNVFNELLGEQRAGVEKGRAWQAMRFLYLSNLGYMGKADCMNTKFTSINDFNGFKKRIVSINFDAVITSKPYDVFLKSIGWRRENQEKARSFILADPPYWSTSNNYQNKEGFTLKDFTELLDFLIEYGVRFAVCEIDRPETKEAALSRGIEYHEVMERRSMKKRNVEVLITNYTTPCKGHQKVLF